MWALKVGGRQLCSMLMLASYTEPAVYKLRLLARGSIRLGQQTVCS